MHKCAYPGAVSHEWDPAKARANLSKHGVDFADAATALEDDRALTIRDPFSSLQHTHESLEKTLRRVIREEPRAASRVRCTSVSRPPRSLRTVTR